MMLARPLPKSPPETPKLQPDVVAGALPDVPEHPVRLESTKDTLVKDTVAGEYVARQSAKMTGKQAELYQGAMRSIRSCGPLRRESVIAATEVARGQAPLTATLRATDLRLGDPYEEALSAGLLQAAAREGSAGAPATCDERVKNARVEHGFLRLADGGTYAGGLKSGEPHGRGEIIGPDGSRFRGAFKDGKRHGSGELFVPGYSPMKGLWLDGRFQHDSEASHLIIDLRK